MAKKPSKPKYVEDDDTPEAKSKAKENAANKKLLERALKDYKLDLEADKTNRDGYKADMLFTLKPGEQWLDQDKTDRGKDRPMYEFNETRVKCKTEINQIRSNRPQAKIRGFEEGDKELAEIRQGLFLNIWNDSDGDSVTDYAAIHQVVGGMGAIRIDTEYAEDSVSEQNIKIRSIINPMCLLADRNARDELKRDARHWFVFTKIPNDEFDAKYPEAERTSFDLDEELEADLDDEDTTWVAEYWVKKPVVRHLCLLSNGKTIDKDDPKNAELPPDVTVVKERKANGFKICQYIISSSAILEGPNDWAGKEFPFVPVYGEYMVVDGKIVWYGLPRFGKDAQRAHNWAMTSVIETIASTSQAKVWATVEQAKGLTGQWAESNKKNFFFNLYNPDPQAPGPPVKTGGADVPVALIQAAQMSATALNNTMGVYEASEGRQSNETSGRAIRARQQAGQIVNYNFGDNMAKAHRRIAEIVIDLQPKIYDTQRNLRILGKDGSEKYIRINEPDAMGNIQNDISAGKFDIVVTTGPSYATQRQEAAEFYTQFSQANPVVGAAAADLIMKAQDYPMSDAIAERIKLMLPPQIQQSIAAQGKQSPEVQAAMAQVQAMEQQLQQQAQMVQEAGQKAQDEQNMAVQAKAQVQQQVSQLKIEQANLAVDIANFKTMIAQQETNFVQQSTALGKESEKQQLGGQLSEQLNQALGQLSQQLGQFMHSAMDVVAQAQAAGQPQIVMPPRPRISKVIREPGGFRPVYEDQVDGQEQQMQQAPAGMQ